jgi:hypothetical protein
MFHHAAAACRKIDHPGLIATHYPDGIAPGYGYCEANAAGERAALGYRQYHRQLSCGIERGGGDDQHGARVALLAANHRLQFTR